MLPGTTTTETVQIAELVIRSAKPAHRLQQTARSAEETTEYKIRHPALVLLATSIQDQATVLGARINV